MVVAADGDPAGFSLNVVVNFPQLRPSDPFEFYMFHFAFCLIVPKVCVCVCAGACMRSCLDQALHQSQVVELPFTRPDTAVQSIFDLTTRRLCACACRSAYTLTALSLCGFVQPLPQVGSSLNDSAYFRLVEMYLNYFLPSEGSVPPSPFSDPRGSVSTAPSPVR